MLTTVLMENNVVYYQDRSDDRYRHIIAMTFYGVLLHKLESFYTVILSILLPLALLTALAATSSARYSSTPLYMLLAMASLSLGLSPSTSLGYPSDR